MALRLALRNPSKRTWWILGGTAAAAAAATGGVLWLRGRQSPQLPVQTSYPKDQSGSGGPVVAKIPAAAVESPVICQRWKTGNVRKSWGPTELAMVGSAVDAAMLEAYEPFSTVDQARTVAFQVTALALKHLCPTWPVPSLPSQVEAYKADPDYGFWWDAAWDSVYGIAWNKVTAAAGGSL